MPNIKLVAMLSIFLLLPLVYIYSSYYALDASESRHYDVRVGDILDDASNIYEMKYRYRYISEREVKEIEKKIGVREENKSYNIIINGHGTGVAPPTKEELRDLLGKKVIDGLTQNISLKSSVRLDLDPHFPPVRSQGSQGSCSAWSVTYYMNGFLQRMLNDWTDSYDYHLMSPAWTYNKVNSGVDDGSFPSDNAKILRDIGCASLYTMPYDDSDYISWGGEYAWREAPLFRIKEYGYVDLTSIEAIKALLDEGYLINFVIDATTAGYGSGTFDGDYILSEYEYNGSTPNHAQTIVGYDDFVNDDGEYGAFRVVNSWGNSWGDSGFYWVTYDCLKNRIAYEWSYGLYLIPINDEPYIPKLLATWRFSSSGARDGDIGIIYNAEDSTTQSISPYLDGGSYSYPEFMVLDITDMLDEWMRHKYSGDFYLYLDNSSTSNTIGSFKIEYYPDYYYIWDPEAYAEISMESPHVPVTISANTYGLVMAGSFEPEIKIWIYEIKGLDAIDFLGNDPDWYYYIGVSGDGSYWVYRMSSYPLASDVNDLYVDMTMSFHANTTSTYVMIELCDKDSDSDDQADISSDSGGGADDVGSPVPFELYYGNFLGEWDLLYNDWLWSDNLTVDSYGFWVTSGEYDGSTSSDENDAEVHFYVWDTYIPPEPDAGPDRVVNINTPIKFSASNSSVAWPDVRIVSYEWDFNGDGTFDAEGENVTWKFTSLGTFNITLRIIDNLGISYTDTCTVKVVDNTPPTISILSPENETYHNTNSITITYEGNDVGLGIDHYEVRIDSGDWINVGKSTTYTVEVQDGKHTITVKAVDKAGNSATDTIEIYVDTTPPALAITSPQNNSRLSTNTITISWNCSDAVSGVDHYEIYLDDSQVNTNIPADQKNYTLTLDNGKHTIRIKAVDKVGNTATCTIIITIFPRIYYYSIILMVIVVSIVIVFIFLRRRR